MTAVVHSEATIAVQPAATVEEGEAITAGRAATMAVEAVEAVEDAAMTTVVQLATTYEAEAAALPVAGAVATPVRRTTAGASMRYWSSNC